MSCKCCLPQVCTYQTHIFLILVAEKRLYEGHVFIMWEDLWRIRWWRPRLKEEDRENPQEIKSWSIVSKHWRQICEQSKDNQLTLTIMYLSPAHTASSEFGLNSITPISSSTMDSTTKQKHLRDTLKQTKEQKVQRKREGCKLVGGGVKNGPWYPDNLRWDD